MEVRDLHPWDVSPDEARRIQARVRDLVDVSSPLDPESVRLVAGVDNAYVRRDDDMVAYAGVVVLTFPELEPVESVVREHPVTFPYVPGLLSFREAPAVVAALRATAAEPDVLLFDAHGYAHPRRLGAASHLGLVADRPSIGCAKSRLVGRYGEPGPDAGAQTPLVDRGELVGAVLRTIPGRPPIFVSAGHRIDLDSAVQIARRCCDGRARLPVPTQMAHDLVTRYTRPLRGLGAAGSVRSGRSD